MRLTRPLGLKRQLFAVLVISLAAGLALMTAGFNVALDRILDEDLGNLVRNLSASERASVRIENGQLAAEQPQEIDRLENQAWVYEGDTPIEGPRVDRHIQTAARALANAPTSTVDVPGHATRLYSYPLMNDGRRLGTIIVAVSTAAYAETRTFALAASVGFATLMLAVLSMGAWWALGAALTPVVRMTEEAVTWSESEPDRRFAIGKADDELSRLAVALDALLDRLAASLRHEHWFSAELSHELRTPLAKITTETELALRRERSTAEYREALDKILASARSMNATTETLLAAANAELNLAAGRSDARMVLEQLAAHCSNARRTVRISIAPANSPGTLFFGVDHEVAMRVLAPIVDNACRFSEASVTLSAARSIDGVVVRIEDDGPGVSPDEVELIFEPGFRSSAVSAPDSAKRGGAGLGLALSRRLARAASGDVMAQPGPGGIFVVHLPAG